jgi:hypothetical protein
MIYLASPYSHEDPEVMKARFEQVAKKASEMMRRGDQLFSPIAHTHPIAQYGLPTGWEFWEQFDRWFIENCDKVVVFMMPGWKESKGVQAEIKMAEEMGKPVEYIS